MSISATNVVIKLGLWKEGEDPIFRYVPHSLFQKEYYAYDNGFKELSEAQLASLGNSNDPEIMLVNRLKRYAISMVLSSNDEDDSTDTDATGAAFMNRLQDYTVALFYKDADGDKVLIYTDEDVQNALVEHQEQKRVKLWAQVREKKNGKSRTSSQASATTQTDPKPAAAAASTAAAQEDKATQMDSNNHSNKDLVDAMADVISCVAVTVHSVVSKDSLKQAKKISKDSLKQAKKVSKDAVKVAKQAAKDASQEVNKQRTAAAQASAAKAAIERAAAVQKRAAGAVKDKSTAAAAKKEEAAVEDEVTRPDAPEPSPKPFIHGRHTCDQCLTTPIVGKRFHATNLPDYDLCESCHGNYQGSEIQFEEATLDRDMPFQERWNRKHEKYVQMQKLKKSGSSSSGRCGPRHSPGGPYRRWGPPPPHHHGGPPHPPFGPPHHRHGGPYRPPHSPFGPPHHHHHCGPPPPPPHHHHGPPPEEAAKDVALAEAIRRSLEDVETKKAASEEQEIVVEAVKPEAVAAEPQNEDDVAVTGSTCKEEEEEEEEDFSDCKEDHEEDVALSEEEEVAIMSVDCNSSVGDESVEYTVKPSSPKSPKREKGESFASGASGDLEMFVGETLDRMGEAIEKLQDDDDDDDEEQEEDDCDVEVNNDEGAKIVEGEDDEDESASRGSWSVVDEEQRIALATASLGSALFNSDLMQQSGEQVSALSHSFHSIGSSSSSSSVEFTRKPSNMSSVTSVPSTVRTLTTETEVPQVQLERWAFQLRGLHELGFLNDAMSVDILETLTAANIGVDSQEEVTIQQVVEQYCEGMKEMAKDL